MPKPTFFNLPEAKRARFVDAAIDEFSSHSFGEASLTTIVKNVGIAKGSVYQYFDDKLDLYRWLVFDEVGRRKQRYLEAAPRAAADFFDRMEDACVAALRFFRGEPRLARLALRIHEGESDPTLAPLFAEARRAGRRWLEAELVRAQKTGEVRADVDPTAAAIALAQILGPAVIDAFLVVAGVDLATALGAATKLSKVNEAKMRSVARGLLGIVRNGIGTPKPSAARTTAARARRRTRKLTAADRT